MITKNLKKAFTLIELLVVIAIIAILAAILFPVFAQAKAAAKITVSLSNMKQVGLGWTLYQNDNEDMFSPRRTKVVIPAGTGFLSWKQLLYTYTKSKDIFFDPVNPAAKYPDDTSDLAYITSLGQVSVGAPLMVRGYAMYDQAFFINQNNASLSFSPSQVEQPSNVLAITEAKRLWVDAGPWLDWSVTERDPVYGFKFGTMGYPWGGRKWDDKYMVNVYIDGHAKKASTSQVCGKDDQLNEWNFIRKDLKTMALGDLSWMDTYCKTRPDAVK